MRWTNGNYELDDDRARIDIDRIAGWLAESYWARSTPEEVVRRSWETAGITLALYRNDALVGCPRAVPDFARTASLADVFIDPEPRGHGLGQWLVQPMIDHPAV